MADEPKTPWGKDDRTPEMRELIDFVGAHSFFIAHPEVADTLASIFDQIEKRFEALEAEIKTLKGE